MAEVQMPELGENITEGTVTQWFKSVGELTTAGEALFGVSTDKVDAEVPSPITGTITEIRAAVGERVAIGAVVALVNAQGTSPAAVSTSAPTETSVTTPAPEPAPAPVASVVPTTVETEVAPRHASVPVTPQAAPSATTSGDVAPVDSRLVTSPVVRKLINELGADAGLVTGTGPDGRITRKDAERVAYSEAHLAQRGRASNVRSAAHTSSMMTIPTTPPAPEGADFVPFNKIRKVTGERMVMSKAISPHVMNVVEVDYERIESVRRKFQDRWKREEGFTLTYLPFIARALVQALREFPHMNASVVEGGLVVHRHVDFNIAVDMNFEGLLAPVMRQVEDKRMPAIAREISELASRARAGKARTEDLANGTFTISNSGPFGSFMVAPVINQPQVAILSTDGVSRKPVVVTDDDGNESIAIHSVGMLVLSWDHRAFDGAYAASFLRRLKDILEHHDWVSEM